MSKSDPSELSRINLLDPPDVLTKKIKKCKTDQVRGLEFGNPDRPECNNLLSLYALLSGQTKEAVAAECAEMGWGQFKPLFTDTVIAALEPIQTKYHEITGDRQYLDQVLRDGQTKAAAVANETLKRVKDALGFLPPL